MRRREFITLLGGATAWPIAARGQQGERMRRIGVHTGTRADDPDTKARVAALEQGLRQLGWTQGRNVRIDYRFSGGDAATSRKQAEELVALAPAAMTRHPRLLQRNRHKADIAGLSSNVRFWG